MSEWFQGVVSRSTALRLASLARDDLIRMQKREVVNLTGKQPSERVLHNIQVCADTTTQQFRDNMVEKVFTPLFEEAREDGNEHFKRAMRRWETRYLRQYNSFFDEMTADLRNARHRDNSSSSSSSSTCTPSSRSRRVRRGKEEADDDDDDVDSMVDSQDSDSSSDEDEDEDEEDSAQEVQYSHYSGRKRNRVKSYADESDTNERPKPAQKKRSFMSAQQRLHAIDLIARVAMTDVSRLVESGGYTVTTAAAVLKTPRSVLRDAQSKIRDKIVEQVGTTCSSRWVFKTYREAIDNYVEKRKESAPRGVGSALGAAVAAAREAFEEAE